MADLKILNREIKKGDLIIGTNSVIKAIKKNEIAKVYVSNDILLNLFSEIEKEANAKKVKIFKLDMNKEQLKELCKKPFFISAYAIKKGNEEEETGKHNEEENETEEEIEERKEVEVKKETKPKKEKEEKKVKEEKEAKKKDKSKKKEEEK